MVIRSLETAGLLVILVVGIVKCMSDLRREMRKVKTKEGRSVES